MEKTRGNEYWERFHLSLGSTVRPVVPWKHLPGDAVETPSLEVLKMSLDEQDNPR